MNIRKELLTVMEQLPEEKLLVLLNLALALKEKNISDEITDLKALQLESQAYQGWVSTENDIYDEIFTDAVTKG
jgi:hypothetical protein